MIEITPEIKLNENELQFDFIRASGPGGQNVNKVATSVQLRFDVIHSPSLQPAVKEKLIRLAGSRMTHEGVLVLDARRFRTQEQNREDAVQRLVMLLQRAAEKPVPRHATRPSLSSKIKRVESKKKRGAIKRNRRMNPGDWE